MKYLIATFILLLSLFAQAQVHTLRSNGAVTPVDPHFSARYSLKIPVVVDTAHAFSNGGLDSLGLVIQIRSTGDWYKRDTFPGGHKWTKVGSGSGSGLLFGVDDTTATGNRHFNAKNKDFVIDSASRINFRAADPLGFSATANSPTQLIMTDSTATLSANAQSKITVTPAAVTIFTNGHLRVKDFDLIHGGGTNGDVLKLTDRTTGEVAFSPETAGGSDSGFSVQYGALAGTPIQKNLVGAARVISWDTSANNPGAITTKASRQKLSDSLMGIIASASAPGGSNTQIQYNNSGTFAGNSGLTYSSSSRTATVDTLTTKKARPDSLIVGVNYQRIGANDSSYHNGTSITLGSGASYPVYNYVSLLGGLLRTKVANQGQGNYQLQKSDNWPLTNCWISAGFYKGFIHRWQPNDKYLIMEWGENDANNDFLFHASFNIDSTWFKSAYAEVLHWAIDSMGWPKANIRIVSPFFQLTSRTPLVYQMKYYTASKTVADSAGIKWIDVFTQGQKAGILNLFDEIHPNNRGHADAAQIIADSISGPIRIGKETAVLSDTTILNNVRLATTTSPDTTYYIVGATPSGRVFKFSPYRFPTLDSADNGLNYGSLTVSKNLNAGAGLRVSGQSTYASGLGFQVYYNGGDGFLDPFNVGTNSHGNINVVFGKLILGSAQTANLFTKLYVRGKAYFQGLYVAQDSILDNSVDSAVNLKMGASTLGNWGGLMSYRINTAGITSYKPTVINWTGGAPALFGTKIDNGLTGSGLQTLGPVYFGDTAMIKNIRDAVLLDSIAMLHRNSDGSFTIRKGAPISSGANPFSDNTAILKNNSDNSKLLKFDLSGLTTATMRTWIVPDANGTFARIDAAQTFTGVQTFNSSPVVPTPSGSTDAANKGYVDGVARSGTYTSTFTNTTNITSSSFNTAVYTVAGSVVTVTITGALSPTVISTQSKLTFSLPPGLTPFSTIINVGTGTISPNGGGFSYVSGLVNTASGTTGEFRFFAGASTSSSDFVITFQYSL